MGCAFRPEHELRHLSQLEPHHQADLLARMAQEARLIHLDLDGDSVGALAEDLERALGQALDAEAPDDSLAAHGELKRVLHTARDFGLRVSASISELSIDGVLGAVKMPVLTARLSAA